VDGAEPRHHAPGLAEDRKLRKYAKGFSGFSQESSPSLEISSMEHHGSRSKSTLAYCGVPYTFVSSQNSKSAERKQWQFYRRACL
jgi:hypothetical protein